MSRAGREMARVLVVEDDRAVREALEVVLSSEGYEVQARSDGRDIERVARAFAPDLALLDVRLPDGPDGLAVAKTLRTMGDVPVLFLTAADSLADRLAGFDAGADDYLVKPFSMAELLARVQALLRRSGRLKAATWRVGDLNVEEDTRLVSLAGEHIDLTRTEFELLVALVRRPGRIQSKLQLVAQVWDYGYDLNVVEVHISALRRKLEAGGHPRMIHTVRGVGYVLRP